MAMFRSARLSVLLAGGIALAQTPSPAPKGPDKASAYYHYSVGHMYEELANLYGNRGDYVNKAIENYQAAIQADPSASFLSEELADLYVQSGKLQTGLSQAEEALKQNPNNQGARRILGRIYTRMIGDGQQGRLDETALRKAIEQYQAITQQSKDDIESWLMLGRLYKVAQKSPEAERAYQHVLDLDANNEDAMSGLAMVYNDLGDTKRATELLQRLVAKNPSLRTLTALASTYEQMRDFKGAADVLRRAVELDSGNADLKRAYAQNLLFADRFDDALKVYQELASDDPKDAQLQLRIGQIYRQQRKFDDARKALAKARELEPDSLDVRYNEVNLLEAEGKTSQAITALKEVLEQTAKKNYSQGERANRIMFLERLGLMYRTNDQASEAIAAFRQIPELDPQLESRVAAQVVDTYRQNRDLNKALTEAEAAAKKFPNDRAIRALHASVLADLGRGDQAAAELRRLLDGKSDRETYLSLAQIYEKAKNYTEMAKAVDEADKLSKSKEEKQAIAFMRGAMYERQKRYDAAEAEFRRVLADDPENASALNYLGYMLADRNVRLNEAQEMIAKALALDPGNGAYLDSLGWVYYRQGKLDEAERYLQQALEKTPKDPTVQDHLGDIYFKAGKLKDAIAQWQSSVRQYESAPPSEQDQNEVAKIQKKLESAKVRLAREGSRVSSKQ